MKILFLTPRNSKENLGGVEKHVRLLTEELKKRGYQIQEFSLVKTVKLLKSQTIVGAYNSDLKKSRAEMAADKVSDKIRMWKKLWDERELVKWAEMVHVHDVFWWYFPFRFIFPHKPVYTTFHGWEGRCPPTKSAIFQKQLAARLSRRTLGVGKFFYKWYGVNPDKISFGALDKITYFRAKQSDPPKKIKKVVFLGRLDPVNDIKMVMEAMVEIKRAGFEVMFVGDGKSRSRAEKIGRVTGMIKTPYQFILEADLVITSSYLSMLESAALGKPVVAVAGNPLKLDYLTSHPLFDRIRICRSVPEIISETKNYNPVKNKRNLKLAQAWAMAQTVEKLANDYEELWKEK